MPLPLPLLRLEAVLSLVFGFFFLLLPLLASLFVLFRFLLPAVEFPGPSPGKPQCAQWAACHVHIDVCDRGFAYNNGRVNMVQHLQHTSHTCNLCVAATIAHIAGESPTVCDPRTARGTISGRDAMVPCCEPCTPPHTANTNTTSCTTLVCDILLPIGGPFRVANLPLIFSNSYLWSVKWQMDIFVAASVSNQWEITIFTLATCVLLQRSHILLANHQRCVIHVTHVVLLVVGTLWYHVVNLALHRILPTLTPQAAPPWYATFCCQLEVLFEWQICHLYLATVICGL